eukprot:5949187-Amphidinium_carterae.1
MFPSLSFLASELFKFMGRPHMGDCTSWLGAREAVRTQSTLCTCKRTRSFKPTAPGSHSLTRH